MAPSQDPEPWFGAKASTTEVVVFRSVADERWMKMKRILTKVEGTLLESKGSQQVARFPFGQFHRDTGFLVYVMGTYAAMTPYLRGFFLTLYGWRADRDIEGWKMKGQLAAHQMEREGKQGVEDNEALKLIEAVSRLLGDVTAMLFLAEGDLPRKVQVRPSCSARVYVGFGDAAKAGYGMAVADVSEANQVAVSSMELTTASGDTMTLTDDSPPVHAEYGHWTEMFGNNSFNHQEMANFVFFLEKAIRTDLIPRGTEIFLFTDNFVTKRAFFRGPASTKSLFDLVLRLRKFHLIWCAGTRMIKQGADGLSRRNLDNGVMIREHMLEHVPIHLSALERVEHLHEWISSWVDPDARFFTPEDWYHNAHQGFACGVWTLPPAIADAALEQLCDARHTRPTTLHVIAIPNIMTYLWRKTLRKLADVMLLVPLGNNIWP
jgi:hypothetical protein